MKIKLVIFGLSLLLTVLTGNVMCYCEPIWKDASDGANPDGAIVMGNEADGTPLFAARAQYDGGLQPGEVQTGFGGAHVGYGGEEVTIPDYEVLCCY